MSKGHHFHSGELNLQQRWDTDQLWDEERKKKLLHDHIPQAYQQRVEETPSSSWAPVMIRGIVAAHSRAVHRSHPH